MLWPGNICAKTFLQFGKAGFQSVTIVDDFALVGSPRPHPASQRTALKILFRLCVRNLLNIAFDANLPPKFGPVKEETRARVFAQLLTFATEVVRVENKTAVVETF